MIKHHWILSQVKICPVITDKKMIQQLILTSYKLPSGMGECNIISRDTKHIKRVSNLAQ